MENTGVFQNHEMTTLVNFDSESSSLMFQLDEAALEKHLDSIADQIINFTTEDSKLTKGFMPQLGLKFVPRLNDHWQSPYLKKYISTSFRKLIQDMNTSQD